MVSAFTIATLVLFEIMRYLTPVMQSEIMVDGGIQVQKEKKKPFDINFLMKKFICPCNRKTYQSH